jgi:hypothetical protein
MSTTFTRTSGGSTNSPDLITGWTELSESGTEVTQLIGGDVAVTVVTPLTRAGTMTVLYSTSAAAATAYAYFRNALTALGLALASTDDSTVNITKFVIVGPITKALDDETRKAWTIEFAWQELI